ncbi:hypothetical protein LOTGIDRAFT_170988 [Lottia gigantea]|uniref:Uncharacterized protein n=1 Tax=Lottia gigantea TaxID=225164 RepID=V4B9N1_LOTGI|nr:hypothetical protein LOTGIDRAFT_170988 [Lottia gigantea]ESP04156.1 hypothetical protein LOTGIDRAFT_170988 [Lottia gigantea]
MANKFRLGSLSLETKKPNTTAGINKAKPYFVDQIGDTLQGDLDMNNFKVTNLKSPENDNDAVHKKYLREQINSIEVNKNYLEDKISNVKRFFKRQLNNKNFVNDTKLQQEVKRLISFIQKELVNVVNKTELQILISLISKLEDKISKQKLDIQQLIDNIPDENEDTFQQELNALETKLNSELQKELRNIIQQIQNIDDSEIKTYIQQQIQNIDDSEIKTYIQQQIQNIDDSEIKTYIQQQIQNIDDNVIQITTINNLVLKQDKNIVALESKSYYFNLPFGNLGDKDASITDNIDRSKEQNTFSSNQLFTARKVLQFIDGRDNVETKEFDINDENSKVNHLYEIKTSGKYIDRFRMLIILDNEDIFLTLHFDMILETETPPSMNIIRNPEPQKEGRTISYQFLRATDFEYVKLYFVNNDIFISIDIHKSQQKQTFLIPAIRDDDVYVNISISITKPKFSVHLNKINDSKEQISLVTVKVVIDDS